MQMCAQDMEPLRLRRAFLNSLIHGGALLVDLGSFAEGLGHWDHVGCHAVPLAEELSETSKPKDTKIDVVADKFNDLEKGLFAKLLDRAVL